jgi:hypothetical protein
MFLSNGSVLENRISIISNSIWASAHPEEAMLLIKEIRKESIQNKTLHQIMPILEQVDTVPDRSCLAKE